MKARLLALTLLGGAIAISGHAQQRALQAAPAEAEQPQALPWQTMVSLRVLERTHDEYAKLHGELVVYPVSKNKTRTYKWGGSSCPGRTLSDTNVLLLSEGLANKMKVQIETKMGAGGSKCIVGFRLGY
jgi:hypothetical protein